MAKKKKESQTEDVFNKQLRIVRSHYDEAYAELTTRITHKEQGFDEYDKLYRSHIDKSKWPFNSRIFIPLTFTSIFNKGSRLITGKIKGKLSATQYGNELGARIGTELLSAQYDDHDFMYEESMVSKWLRMDQNARKYGAAFALVPWRYETQGSDVVFDGPTFEVLDNRKVYLQPGTVSIFDSDYVIVEREMTLMDLENKNDVSEAKHGKPAYMNLDALRQAVSTSTGSSEYPSTNTNIRGLSNKSEGFGKFKKFKVLTEYRRDFWITWCPDVGSSGRQDDKISGTLLRAIPNPYKHKMIPIIRLVYIPIDDDVYGVSEIEPARSEQKAVNALASGLVEAVSTELYPIIKGHPTNVDWKTIEFKPRAAWIMNNPQTDIVERQGNISFISSFVQTYRTLVAAHSQSMADTTSDSSQLDPGSGNQTATEIRDLATLRNSRDNLNKIFLSASIAKMYALWWSMDQQFLTDKKVIKVVGKEAIEYFTEEGLTDWTLTDEGYQAISTFMDEHEGLDFNTAYETLRGLGELDQYAEPLYPVKQKGEVLPKLQMEKDGKSGFLSIDSKDLSGQYRFVVDLNTIGQKSTAIESQALNQFLAMTKEFSQEIMREGYEIKYKELLETVAEKMEINNPDQFFKQLTEEEQGEMQNPQMMQGQPPMPQGGGMPMQQEVQPNDMLGQMPSV